MRYWSFFLFRLVGTLLLVTVSPGGVEADVRQGEHSPRVLRFGVHVSEIGRMDPHLAAGSQDRVLADMVFNGLLRYQPGHAPKIEPDLAERVPEFEMVDGRQVWTIHLRRGVMFHPGPQTEAYELTADDVVFSLEKSADTSHSAYAGEYTGMTVEKIDQYTVQIALAKPLSPTLFLPKIANYAGGFIVSKRAVESMGYDQFNRNPVGTGPFVFQKYEPGRKLTLSGNVNYFRGKPLLDGVELNFIPGVKQREAALLDGTLDLITGSGEKGWLEKIEQEQGLVIDTFGVGEVSTLFFNTKMKPLDDVRVRKAIAYALGRDIFLDTLNKRVSGRVYSPVPGQFLPGGLNGQQAKRLGLAYAQDLDKARQLLTDAGHANGFSLDLVASEKRLYHSTYVVLREQLARVGIQCRLKTVPHGTMHKLIRNDPRALVLYVAWRPNADVYLTRFFHSDSIIVTGSRPDTNFSHYDRIDRLIEDARLQTDPGKQINLWEQAQVRILSDMAAFPIMYTNQLIVRRSHVDYGHELVSTMALYPQFTEKTALVED